MARLPAWWLERQVRPDNFISASNSCQKIWQNRFFVIGKQKEMRKEKTFWHLPSLLTHESWSKVCKTCNKHCFWSYIKKQCARHLLWNRRELGQSVNTNGSQKVIDVCIFHASVKTKEVKRDWFFPRVSWWYWKENLLWLYRWNVDITVPLKSKLPPSREMRIASRETRLSSLETRLSSLETRLSSRETRVSSRESVKKLEVRLLELLVRF